MAVAGNQQPPFDETIVPQPVDPYGTNKAAIELVLKQLATTHDFTYVIFRPHNVFGVGTSLRDPYRNLAGIMMNRIMRGETLYIYGKEHRRAFSYIDDCLPSLLTVVNDGPWDGEIINIGGKQPVVVEDFVEEIIKNFPNSKIGDIVHLEPRPHEVKDAWCTTEKSEKLLGYKEKVGWKKGVRRMADWAREQGPQSWRVDQLPLLNRKAPLPWRELREIT